MELLQLKYFRTVARLEHMTRAAEQLHIAQPALSRTISRLEEDLGVPLFDRVNRQIRLNAFGKAFLSKVESALSLLEEGTKEVMELAGLERGTISIATNTLNCLSPAVAAFRERFPDVSFRINQIAPAETYSMGELLEQGHTDLGFGPVSLRSSCLRELSVLQSEVFLAVPCGHRLEKQNSITLGQAADAPFIEYKIGHPFRQVNDEISRRAGIKRNIICEVDEPAALHSLVQTGLGVAFVPKCKWNEVSQYSLLPIKDSDNKHTFFLSWNETRYLSEAAREFQHFLIEYYADEQK
ncbi:DNA-binding transcriptional LysR family regulator [Paenibacillus cellulosilyticus]|uniref:DNA-binding transcriptional LysR family regulator n=1 Tax=Paenibacillus cellulosilyticus TaxID=375489 RepID=A0A2V2YTF3_9BACL|nr:LysR family transcriptional regulator [Paenibacillus cellulosilyticus]PWW02401.1 DNA-binding transcriptional LysR family regulator [Paenibacillus cellulosilyticus]QKS47113.1 LysR family transcriptional regulator [Paenibacillus cellulosilyticus]